MNKELIQRFLDRACYDEQDQRELEDWCNVEKLTRLIVEECVDAAEEAQADFYVINNIKQRFGVVK
jgi:hypothetical protein